MYVVLIYDIADDENGAKASRNIFKTCKKYLTHVQKSIAFITEIADIRDISCSPDLPPNIIPSLIIPIPYPPALRI
jgi:hypothetical protein